MNIRSRVLPVIFGAAFIFCSATAFAQVEISELRGSIQTLEQIVHDPAIPEVIKDEYRGQLLEKRAHLHSLLKQRLRFLQDQRDQASDPDLASIDNEISGIRSAITELLRSGNSGPASSRQPADVSSFGFSPSPDRPAVVGGTIAQARTATASPDPGDVSDRTPRTIDSGLVSAATGGSGVAAAAPAATNTPSPQVTPQSGRPDDGNVTTIQQNLEVQLDSVAANIRARKAASVPATQANRMFELSDLPLLIPLALTAPRSAKPGATVAEFTAKVEESRNDKQVGADASSSGTTTLVSKGAVPAIFGFAVENGGLDRSQNGTSVTFRGNPVGIIEALAGKGYISSYQKDTAFERGLRNFAFGLTFDASRGDQVGIFTGGRQQLSSFSFRYNIFNQRDPRDRKYTELWENLVTNQSVPVVNSLGVIVRRLLANRAVMPGPFKDWLDETERLLTAANPSEVDDVLRRQLEILQSISLPADVASALGAFETNYTSFLNNRDKIIKQVSNGWLVTAEYTNNRPVDSPSISNFNFIVEKGAWNGSIDLTANASVSFFNSRPNGASDNRLRDFRFAGQLDVPLGNAITTGRFLLSLAGRYERLLEDYAIPNTTVIVPKGDIGVFQAKLVIPIRGTAFKIPLSVSFANRTELLRESEIRGNFGFTFDIDSILARFNPFTAR